MLITDLFNAIGKIGSTVEKVKLLQGFEDQETLKTVLLNAYSSEIVFEITSNGLIAPWAGNETSFPIEVFQKVLETSGRNAKHEAIKACLVGKSKDVQKYVMAAIDKDLGIGINTKLINKAFPGLIKEFKLMLAQGGKKKDAHKNIWIKHYGFAKEVYVNLKIDGLRCVMEIVSAEEINFYSRDGKILSDFLVENIRKEIKQNIEAFGIGSTYDGEIYCDNFQALMKIAQRKEITASAIQIRNTARYAIFDVIERNEEEYGAKTRLDERVKFMQSLPQDLNFIKFVKYIRVANDYSLLSKMARHYISKGNEGIVVKNTNAFYEYKRSFFWLKFKNSDTIDLKIIGTEPGEKGTKYEKCLGVIVLDFGDGKSVRCGSGFTDKERIELWKDKENLIGKVAEIEYMEETQGGESLRHPVFRCIRIDKTEGER